MESSINGFVETLAGLSSSVRRALIAAIWGTEELQAIEKRFDVARLALLASGSGADWKLFHEGRLLRVAEHKPRRAVAHWPIAQKTDFNTDLLVRIPGDEWIENITDRCSVLHSPTMENRCRHPWYYTGANRLSAPQPLVYLAEAHEHGVGTLTIVTDRVRATKNVNEIWDTAMVTSPQNLRTPLKLRDDLFPVRSTVHFLTDLMDTLDLDGLDDRTCADVRALFEAMWVRERCPRIDGVGPDLLRPGIEDCPHGEDCVRVPWKDFASWYAQAS